MIRREKNDLFEIGDSWSRLYHTVPDRRYEAGARPGICRDHTAQRLRRRGEARQRARNGGAQDLSEPRRDGEACGLYRHILPELLAHPGRGRNRRGRKGRSEPERSDLRKAPGEIRGRGQAPGRAGPVGESAHRVLRESDIHEAAASAARPA